MQALHNDIARKAHDIVMHENGSESHTPHATANTPHLTQTFDQQTLELDAANA